MSKTEPLPRWNLKRSFGYTSPDDPQIEKDLASYRRFCLGFRNRYKGKIAKLGALPLVQAIDRYHSRNDLYRRLTNYIDLALDRNNDDPAIENLHQRVRGELKRSDEIVAFFDDELVHLPKERARVFQRNPKIEKKYKVYLKYCLDRCSGSLALKEEQIVEKLSPLIDDLGGLYGKINANQKFTLGGRALDYSTILSKMGASRDPNTREQAFKSFVRTVAPHRTVYEAIMNAGIKYRANYQKIYDHNHPTDQWLANDDIEDFEVSRKMLETAKDSGITPRFLAIKAKLMGKKQLNPWDVFAPLPDAINKRYKWSEAQDIIVSAFSHFHPELGAIAAKAFKEGWIDAAPAKGKYPGLGLTYEGSKKTTLMCW
jgi:oligoendopeptidase F